MDYIELEIPTLGKNISDKEDLIRTKRDINYLTNFRLDHFPAYLMKPSKPNSGSSTSEKVIQKNFNTWNIDLDASNNTNIRIYLIIILAMVSLKKLLQIVLISRLSFFSSVPDWVN